MKVALVGGRKYTHKGEFYRLVDRAHARFSFSLVISGGAQGADTLAYLWSIDTGLTFTCFPPKPEDGYPAKFFRRNVRIANLCEMMIAFPDPNSSGTYHALQKAYDLKKQTFVVLNGIPQEWKPP